MQSLGFFEVQLLSGLGSRMYLLHRRDHASQCIISHLERLILMDHVQSALITLYQDHAINCFACSLWSVVRKDTRFLLLVVMSELLIK